MKLSARISAAKVFIIYNIYVIDGMRPLTHPLNVVNQNIICEYISIK